jgi:hypothetical protein
LAYGRIAAKVVSAECVTILGKNISQSIVRAGEFSQDRAGFDGIMLKRKG